MSKRNAALEIVLLYGTKMSFERFKDNFLERYSLTSDDNVLSYWIAAVMRANNLIDTNNAKLAEISALRDELSILNMKRIIDDDTISTYREIINGIDRSILN